MAALLPSVPRASVLFRVEVTSDTLKPLRVRLDWSVDMDQATAADAASMPKPASAVSIMATTISTTDDALHLVVDPMSTGATHAFKAAPQLSPTTSTLKILEQMVAEEEKLVLSLTSGTIVLLPDHQQKPRSLSLDVAMISPNDVRSPDADSTATTGTDPAERLSPPPRTPSGEWASEIRLRHFEHAQRLHRAASQANFRAARKMTELARHEESQSWPGASRVPGLQRQRSTSLPIGYFHASSDTEAQFSRWAADDFADPKHEETPLRRLLMSLHAIFGCDRAFR